MITSLQNEKTTFVPTKLILVDIDFPLPNLMPQDGHHLVEYSRALILVRFHNQPIGLLDVNVPPNGLDGNTLGSLIWEELRIPLRDHLIEDGLSLESSFSLKADGLALNPNSICLQKKNELLKAPPFVSIVIATRDRVDSLRECLRSILDLDYPDFEIIVVDNAPKSDATERFIRSEFPGISKVRYLREDIPGLAMAHNRALSELRSSIVAFTDDDVLVDRHWLNFIVQNFQRDPKVACVTGMILPYELETPPQLWIEQFGGFGKGFKRIRYDIDENRPDDILYPYSAGRFGSGANMSFRSSVLRSMGGFDPALGAGTIAKGGDDLAVFFDVIINGHRLVYEPGAILYHKHRRDYSGLANQAYGYGVGLSAYLMRTILKNPKRFLDVLFRIPAGLMHILNPHSPKNIKKESDYPKELTGLELKGFLRGPFAYLQSRYKTRQLMKSSLSSSQTRVSEI